MGINKVAVVIPVYKPTLEDFEKLSLKRCFEVLGSYSIIGIKPDHLVPGQDYTAYNFHSFVSFDNFFFSGVQGYNQLMLSESFYASFNAFDYILVYQLDCFVFRDELQHWCQQDYDYIGAPWLSDYKHPDIIKATKEFLFRRYYIPINLKDKYNPELPSERQFRNMVGNGGFSLRKVKKFKEICQTHKEKIAFYNTKEHHYFNEDIFFSIEVNRRKKVMNIPKYTIASQFSLENNAHIGMVINKGKLPFGCHDWDNNKDFWRPYFREIGYGI